MRYRDRIALSLLALATFCFVISWNYKYLPARPAALDATLQHVGSVLHSAASPYLPHASSGKKGDNAPSTTANLSMTQRPTNKDSWITKWEELKPGSPELLENALPYVASIMNSSAEGSERLSCPPTIDADSRYDYLRSKFTASLIQPKRRYFFALDLYQCVEILPSLLGAVVETIRFLGPEYSTLSIVEGRSNDGTYEVLKSLREEMDQMGVEYHLGTNDVDPKSEGTDRIAMLADLRNQALDPIYTDSSSYASDATVIFINDVSLCVEDILELVHQRVLQGADMTCAMDWIYGGSLFYDVWVSRGISGDSFFEIPQTGTWDFATNLFWNDESSRTRLDAYRPFQVYACWNGIAVFTAEPLIREGLKFRRAVDGECFMGEPTLFCKDFWRLGYSKIATVPSVNVAYGNEESALTKSARGYVHDHVEETNDVPEQIVWQKDPPPMVKCTPDWDKPSWVPPL